MVIDIDAVVDPITASLAVGALDYQFIKHVFDNLGDGSQVFIWLDVHSASRASLATLGLGRPGVIEAFAAEIVFAGKLDGLIEGSMADEADEIAIGGRDVFEGLILGGNFDDSASSTLR